MTDYTIGATKVRPLSGSITSTKQLAEAADIGEWVYVNADDKVALTDASDGYTSGAQVGMLVAGSRNTADGSLAADEWVTVVWFGRVAVVDAALDPTKHLYLSDNAGKVADAPGTYSRRVGAPESVEIIFINPSTVTPAS